MKRQSHFPELSQCERNTIILPTVSEGLYGNGQEPTAARCQVYQKAKRYDIARYTERSSMLKNLGFKLRSYVQDKWKVLRLESRNQREGYSK